jgi:hypothetical protein
MWIPDTIKNIRVFNDTCKDARAEPHGMKDIPLEVAAKIKADIESISVDIPKA